MSPQEDLLQSCRTAFAGGYNAVKLYFMLGLPTETDEDVLGIADLAARVMHTWRESASNKNRGVPHHRLHIVVRSQAPYGLSVGAADLQGGV